MTPLLHFGWGWRAHRQGRSRHLGVRRVQLWVNRGCRGARGTPRWNSPVGSTGLGLWGVPGLKLYGSSAVAMEVHGREHPGSV